MKHLLYNNKPGNKNFGKDERTNWKQIKFEWNPHDTFLNQIGSTNTFAQYNYCFFVENTVFCFQVAPQVNLNQNFFLKMLVPYRATSSTKRWHLGHRNFMYRNISVFWKPFLSNLWRTTDAHWTQTQKYTNSFETYQRIWGAHHLTNPLYEQFWSVLWCKLFVFESTKCWQE